MKTQPRVRFVSPLSLRLPFSWTPSVLPRRTKEFFHRFTPSFSIAYSLTLSLSLSLFWMIRCLFVFLPCKTLSFYCPRVLPEVSIKTKMVPLRQASLRKDDISISLFYKKIKPLERPSMYALSFASCSHRLLPFPADPSRRHIKYNTLKSRS